MRRNSARVWKNESVSRASFHDFDFGFGQAVEVIDQRVDLAVERGAFVFVIRPVLLRLRRGQLLQPATANCISRVFSTFFDALRISKLTIPSSYPKSAMTPGRTSSLSRIRAS